MRKKIAPYLAMIVTSMFAIPFVAALPAHKSSGARQAPTTATPAKPKPVPPLYPKDLSIVSQSAEGGLWRTDGAFQSSMMLKNILVRAPMPVTPVLYMADGTEYDLPPVQLDKAGVAMINLNAALQNVPSNIQPHVSTYGSAAIRYQWAWKTAVTASIRIGDDVNSLAYLTHLRANANETHNTASPQVSQVHEGMWWKQEPGVTGFLAITNTSLTTVTATFQVFDSGSAGSVNQTIVVTPHNTYFAELSPIWSQIPGNPSQGGMRISYTGTKHALQTEGGLMDIVKGYSHMINLAAMPVPPIESASTSDDDETAPPSPTAQSISLDSTGMMIGTQDPNMQFPSGTQFVPYEVLRNISSHPLLVQLTANYLNQATITDAPLGTVSLSAGEVQQVDLKGMMASAGLGQYNGLMNLRTSFVGYRQDLLAEAGSLDQTMSYVFETPPLWEANSGPRILPYWNTVGDTDTMITVWNHSAQAQDLILTFYHQEGRYKLPIHLPANGSATLSMASLIKSGQPDPDGNSIPANITQGSAKLTSATRETARLQVSMHTGIFNVRTATCTCCCDTCDPYVDQAFVPDAINEGVNDQVDFYAYVYLEDDCVDVTEDIDNFHSDDSSIAQLVYDDPNYTESAVGEAVGATVFEGDDQEDVFDAHDGYDCNGDFGDGGNSEQNLCGATYANHFALDVTVVAIPTNFREVGTPVPGSNGFITYRFAWDSTSGNLADLSPCTVFEIVGFPGFIPGITSTYTWKHPPYQFPSSDPNVPNPSPNPILQGTSAVVGLGGDVHRHVPFLSPYASDDFIATQVYAFQCTNYFNNQAIQLYPFSGVISIERMVSPNTGSTWKYVITISSGTNPEVNATNSVNPLP
ncbi:MAG: hypothetical protein WAM91_16455 [Candidatus Acidiferrales bacterium]